ncbi:interacting protein [Mactra antiquata]
MSNWGNMSATSNSSFVDVSGQEASDILAAALQQMDGIIAGTKFDNSSNGFGSLPSTPDNTLKHPRGHVTEARIIKLIDDLKLALELCNDKFSIIRKLPDDVISSVITWLQQGREETNKVKLREIILMFKIYVQCYLRN